MLRTFNQTRYFNALENPVKGKGLIELGKMLDSMDKANPTPQLNSKNSDRKTAMVVAAEKGNSALLRKLIDFVITYIDFVITYKDGKNIGIQIDSFNDALIAAAQHGHPACVRKLLENFNNLFITSGSLNKALKAALEYGQTACLRVILEYLKKVIKIPEQSSDLERFFTTLNQTSAAHGHTECSRLLKEYAEIFDISPAPSTTSSPILISEEPESKTDTLISSADKRKSRTLSDDMIKTFALSAAQNGQTEYLRYLLSEYGVDVLYSQDDDGNTLAMLAAENGHFECLEWLIDTKYKHQASTKLLLDDDSARAMQTTPAQQTPINLDAQNSSGETAISLVAKEAKRLRDEGQPFEDHVMCMALLLNENVWLYENVSEAPVDEKPQNESNSPEEVEDAKTPHEKLIDLFRSKTIKNKLFDCMAYAFHSNKSMHALDQALKDGEEIGTTITTLHKAVSAQRIFGLFGQPCSKEKGTWGKIDVLWNERQGFGTPRRK